MRHVPGFDPGWHGYDYQKQEDNYEILRSAQDKLRMTEGKRKRVRMSSVSYLAQP